MAVGSARLTVPGAAALGLQPIPYFRDLLDPSPGPVTRKARRDLYNYVGPVTCKLGASTRRPAAGHPARLYFD